MYCNGWSSLEAVPLSELPDLQTDGVFMNVELCTYEIITSAGVRMIQPRRGKILRDHIQAKIAALASQMPLPKKERSRSLTPLGSPILGLSPLRDDYQRDTDKESDSGPGEQYSDTGFPSSGPLQSPSPHPDTDEEYDSGPGNQYTPDPKS